jgi:hypothetical protein
MLKKGGNAKRERGELPPLSIKHFEKIEGLSREFNKLGHLY